MPKLNLRSTAVKRIMQEAAELAAADVDDDGFVAAPLEDDIFEWHCTMRGVPDSEYDGGLYHFRIVLPPSYPMSAPDIILLTPNGRFELGKKICIDGLTSFHAGSWQPAWGVRTAIVGLRSFWMQSGEALSAIGALDHSKEERKRLARLSAEWKCPTCGIKNEEIMPRYPAAVDEKEGGKGGNEDVKQYMDSGDTVDYAAACALKAEHIEEAGDRGLDSEHLESRPTEPEPQAEATDLRASASPEVISTSAVQTSPSSTQITLEPCRTVPLWLDHLIGGFCIALGLAICKRVGTYILS
ncbi:ubiquitin conjugating enzyme, putative [Cryptococcus deneoformans JEC21]|uniref:Ubiquitin conjugating enzyme, putative n=1 Tax=Cryptococcus deneoformans (strain JEC21 / ATCC MYA-565) TaxID=214684 RepID=Q5KGK7_CRYD1|nr:ubiquitin conjugating enzyme, putative [Cryptococcus neoformans var. neoformans JEC21]AAW43579.1 ubiquitin conjugating enzyme, putative [Cryptococcus neoformans var. neoformans JEC21]